MNNSLLPVALGMAASFALPLHAQAHDTEIETEAIARSDLQVQADVPPSDAEAEDLLERSASAEMPVAQEAASYVEPSGALNFEPKPVRPDSPVVIASRPAPPVPSAKEQAAATPSDSSQDIFAGGSESFVARTVGAAEGTRSADGGKTQNYHGHVDPGNGVWNRGTFSYQFGNAENLSPDEADRRQLAKIKRIYESVMLPKAEKHKVAPLTLEEEINGIDLINQAPLTVTEDGGYIERLAEAKQKGLTGDEAILNARIWSFWDAGKGGWDAPGLRAYDDISKEESIRRDQDRRMGMIAKAMQAYEQQHGTIARRRPVAPTAPVAHRPAQAEMSRRTAIADAIIGAERPTTRG